jgi:hypothetical protein
MAILSTNSAVSGVQVTTDKVPGLKIRTQNWMASPPQTSLGTAKDIDALLPLIDAALKAHQERLAIDPAKRLVASSFWPKDVVDRADKATARVVMRLFNRRKGNFSNDGTREQRRPMHKETRPDPKDPSRMITVQSLWRDNTIEFRVMSADQSRADDMALFFELFMEAWNWYFHDKGIQDLRFEERLEDRIEVIGGTEVYVRPLRYHVRTETIYQTASRTLSDIRVQFDDGLTGKETVVDEELGISDYSVD